MRIVFDKYGAQEQIPIYDYVRNRKMVKYYNRETMAAVVVAKKLIGERVLPPFTPFFYSSGEMEYLDFFKTICIQYIDGGKREIDTEIFIESVLPKVSPVEQFKLMRNMTSCFVSIENGLRGENTVSIHSASAMLYSAILAEKNQTVIIGAGQLYFDGSVECGFAEVKPEELIGNPLLGGNAPALDFFKNAITVCQ